MALSNAQKFQIIRLLGYPYGTLTTTSLDYSKIISDKLTGLPAEAQVEVENLLEWIDETETQIDAAISVSGIRKIEDIEFFGGSGEQSKADTLRGERKRYIDELSSLLGISNRSKGGRMGSVSI